MLESLFNKFADLQSEILLNERLNHGYFSMKKFFRATASDTLKLNVQTFNSKYLNSNSNSSNSILINTVDMLYLMIRNLDFIFMIDHVFQDLDFTVELLQEQFLA